MTTVEIPTPSPMPPGLKGVAVTDTEIGDVRGLEGFYHYRQYSATDLAERRSLEDVWRLLLDGSLPAETSTRRAFEQEVRRQRSIPDLVRDLLPGIANTVRAPGLSTGCARPCRRWEQPRDSDPYGMSEPRSGAGT